MEILQRYDSLFQFYAEWNRRDTTGERFEFLRRPRPLDWGLLKRQAVAESGLDPDAVSRVGAQGLTQFMPATWAEHARQELGEAVPMAGGRRHLNPFDPEDAISAQSDMMAWLLDRYTGDQRKALAAYNWGLGNVDKSLRAHGEAWDVKLPVETKGYLVSILV